MYSSKCIVCDTELSLESNTIDGQVDHKIWDTFCAFFHPSSPITNDIVSLSFCPTCSLKLANLQLLLHQLKSIESRMFKIIACISSKIIENCAKDTNSGFEAQQIKLELHEFAVNELSTDKNSNHRIDKKFNDPATINKNIVTQISSIRTEVWNSFRPQLKLSNCQEPTSKGNDRSNRNHVIIHHWPKNTPQSEETDEATEKDTMDDGEENETPIDDDDFTTTLDDSIESESDDDDTDDEEEKKEKQRKYWRDKRRRLALGIKKRINHLAVTLEDGTFAYNEWTFEQTEGGRFKCHACSTECGSKTLMNRHIKKQHIIASGIGKTGKKIVKKLRLVDCGDGKFIYGGTWSFTAHPINGYECSTCNKYNRSKDGIMRHIKLAHRPGSHTCEHCGKRYTSDFKLGKHRCEVPRSNYGQVLDCGEGKFIYFSSGDLNKKFEFEQIGDKFKCSVCGHTMKRRDNMCQHIKSRHAEKKVWMCETCGKSFWLQGEFRDHLSVHSDARPHLCSTCGKTFKTQHDIRKHLRLNHQTLEYKCEYCGRLCKTPLGLLQHQQSRHIPKDNNHTVTV